MAQPYVQFVINGVTKAFHDDSVRYEPDLVLPISPFDWKVVCDANGRIVVRSRGAVVATARRENGFIRETRTVASTPDAVGWRVIDQHLSVLLTRSPHPPDPLAIDAGELDLPLSPPAMSAPLPAPSSTDVATQPHTNAPHGFFARTWHVITVIVGVLGVILAFAYHTVHGYENGRGCDHDSDCHSNYCDAEEQVCQPTNYRYHHFSDGSHCSSDIECASDNCYNHRCYAK